MKNNIAILLHLYYCDLWEEFQDNFSKIPYSFSLYINLTEGNAENESTKEKILKLYPNAIIITSPNQGMDIGGRLRLLHKWITEGDDESFLIFLHSKKSLYSVGPEQGLYWRTKLLEIISLENCHKAINIFNEDGVNSIGMLAPFNYIVPTSLEGEAEGHQFNIDDVKNYCTEFNIRYDQEIEFVAGTMFWVKSSIYKSAFKNGIALQIANSLEDGYGNGRGRTHIMERVLGGIITAHEHKIQGI